MLKVINEKNGKIKPTHLMYKSNLSHGMMENYLQELIEKNFIKEMKKQERKNIHDHRKRYRIPKKVQLHIRVHRQFWS